MSLTGRDEELERIDRLLADASDDRSAALVLRGEAGIGKSALLDTAMAHARSRGFRVIRATGVESDASLAYAGLHQLLFPHLDLLDVLPVPQAEALRGAFGLAEGRDVNRFLISAGTLALLAELAEDAPLLCVVDDLQWFDQGSAEALLFAARRFEADPITMLLAVRETSMPFDTPGVAVMQLSGLAADDAARMLAAHAPHLADPLRTRVLEESAGNPLAILELGSFRGGADDVGLADPAAMVGALPASRRVQEAFRRRIAALPAASRRALLVAAADSAAPIGTALRVIEALGGAAADLALAEEADLIRVDDRVEFRHPLVRAAAYRGEPLHHRTEVHRVYAEALIAEPDRRAWHLAAATVSPDETVAAELDGVAERARHRGGPMAVSIAYERAARLSPEAERRARRIARAAQAAFDAGKPDRAVRLAAESLTLSADLATRAEAIYVQGAVAYERTAPRADVELALEAHALVRDIDPERAALTLYEAVHAARHAAAHDLLFQAADRIRGFTPSEQWAPVVAALLGWADLFDGRPEAAVGPIRGLGTPVGHGEHELMHRMTRGIGGLLTADEERAASEFEEMLRQVRASGAIGWVPYALNALAVARLLRGEFADAGSCVAEGATISADLGNETEQAAHRSLEIWLLAAAGAESRCRELAARVLPGALQRHRVNAEIAAWGLAVLDLSARRFEQALDGLEAVCTGPARRDVLIRAVPDLVEAAVRTGAPDRARPALAEFDHWADRVGRPVATGLALRCRALLAGDDDAAGALYAESVRLLEGHGGPYEHARSLLVHGEWLRRRRRRTEARSRLEAAATGFESVGAALWAERASRELAALGGARGVGRGSPLAVLTAQELQVVQLAAAGHTNKEIAARLYVSPRTVGHHLYNAYPKLGVTSRGELAALV